MSSIFLAFSDIGEYYSIWYDFFEETILCVKNLELFLTFMKIGAFTFGGRYAMIPQIHKEVCENKKWLNEKASSDQK